MRCNTDLETWLHDYGDRIYRVLEYRKPGQYTPRPLFAASYM